MDHPWPSPSPNRYNDDLRPGKHNSEERFENIRFTGFFQGQANLNTSRLAGYYYNTCTRNALEDPLTNQALEDKISLWNQRIWNYDQVPPPTPIIIPIEITKVPQPPRMTRSQLENKERNSN